MSPYIKASKYEPNSPEERVEGISVLIPLESRNGYAFALATTQKMDADAEDFLQLLGDQMRRLANSFGQEANAQHRFEQFLGALNETMAQSIRDGKFRIPIEQVNAIVGIVTEHQMFISGTGDLTALFLHRKPSQRYQVFNLFRGIQTEQTLPSWEKPFAVVLDGDLHTGDVFCVTNKDIQRTIESNELNAILTTLPPKSASEKIRQYYSHKEGLLLIVIRIQERQETETEDHAKPLSDVSIEKFNDAQEKTKKLLEDQRPKIGTFAWMILEKVFRKKDTSRLLKDLKKGEPKWKLLIDGFRILSRFLFKLAKRSSGKALLGVKTLSKKEGRARAMKKVVNKTNSVNKNIHRLKDRLQRLPKSTQYLCIGTIVVVLIFIFGVSFLSKSQARSAEMKAYTAEISKIDELIERGSGAVIYKDENQARSLFQSAIALVDKLPEDTEERIAKKAQYKTDIQVAGDELRHLVTIPNPALLADLTSVTDGVFANAIVKKNDDLYVFASDRRVYRLDRTQKVFKVSGTQPEDATEQVVSVSEDNGRIYALDRSQNIIQYNSDELTQAIVTVDTENSTNWIDIKAYANRLYTLESLDDGKDAQIMRFGKTGDTFGTPTKWISSKNTSLAKPVSFVIDGSIFILRKDGKVVRFINGSEVGWDLGVVDPPITAATRIWTNSDSAYLYILEPATKRLIVFQKETGAFVAQYRSEAFVELTDFLVDESHYSVYLLSGSKLYSIAASHIE